MASTSASGSYNIQQDKPNNWIKAKNALNDFFGLDDEDDHDGDVVDSSHGNRSTLRHREKWNNRFHSLASDAFLGTLDHVRERKRVEEDGMGGAMEMTQRGAYSGIDADERSLPTERINTARHGKRTLTDRPPRHDYAQDNVFNLTYNYYQDWMKPHRAQRKIDPHDRSYLLRDLQDVSRRAPVGFDLKDDFFDDITSYEHYREHMQVRGRAQGIRGDQQYGDQVDFGIMGTAKPKLGWNKKGGWQFYGKTDDRDALLDGEDEVDSVPTRRGIRSNVTDQFKDDSDRLKGWFIDVWKDGLLEQCLNTNLIVDESKMHRPFFTYWMTFVQLIIIITAMSVYGLAPYGITEKEISRQIIQPNLAYEKVAYFEQSNIWVGPRMADLIHLGAKYSPCIRDDDNIEELLDDEVNEEYKTACCVNNDGSGCVQTSRRDCSPVLSEWIKWDGVDRGDGIIRSSGSVCGTDPKYCRNPASVGAHAWKDDITLWPLCTSLNTDDVPLTDENKHLTCELLGRPCCYGIQGECMITTYDYCSFLHGHFHEEATLCSQISCLEDVCGMLPFADPQKPDQFYRFWLALFLHAGIIHFFITLIVNLTIIRPMEKMNGWIRTVVIFLGSGMAGSLASAIFVPYKVDSGPTAGYFGVLGSHLVTLVVFRREIDDVGWVIGKFAIILGTLFFIGFLPMIDNWAHLFGFIFGCVISFIVLPFAKFQSARRITVFIVSVLVAIGIVTILIILFYVLPIYECDGCQYFSCIPITENFCKTNELNVSPTRYTQ